MDKNLVAAIGMFIFSVIGEIHLARVLKRDWQDRSKRGNNIVFIVAMIFGALVFFASAYKIIISI